MATWEAVRIWGPSSDGCPRTSWLSTAWRSRRTCRGEGGRGTGPSSDDRTSRHLQHKDRIINDPANGGTHASSHRRPPWRCGDEERDADTPIQTQDKHSPRWCWWWWPHHCALWAVQTDAEKRWHTFHFLQMSLNYRISIERERNHLARLINKHIEIMIL